ncbi:MAG: extracellular solute-binding protein [Lachnospiraceae bacterium]|jgi:ABC-type glycerol-3-phosphate transport system substrate-binding protein|nr:extracellular solute-binding protein [Lachnospiraceae bacterium]MCX4305325.1 extracellular solute-binding protein [Acetatifactor sp.]
MKSSVKKALVAVGIIAAVVVVGVLMSLRGVEDFHEKYEGCDLTADVEGMERTGTYTLYLLDHADAVRSAQSVEVDLFDYTAEGDAEEYKNYEGVDRALYTGTGSLVTWEVNVPETGFYNIYMEYLIPESRGVAAERAVYINGEIPFDDARNISFTRIWTDGGDVRVDNQGNEIRPTQTEVYGWQTSWFRDDMGYITEPYCFYLEKGVNRIGLGAENEPVVVKKLVVSAVQDLDTYEEYLAKQPSGNASEAAANYMQVIQGEDSTIRSESSLYAKYDRSSPTTQPNSVTTTVLNYVGGDAWRSAGQWIEWDFEVPEDGYYNIMVKGRQNYSRGSVSNRSVYIDGEIPFLEMKEVSFDYSNDWNCLTLADEEGTPYQFYLTAGVHTFRMEASLGGLGSILEELEDSTYRLNQIYRKILVYTGATPDQYRDYRIEVNYPEIMEAMDLESKRLFKIVDEMVAYSGQKADQIATAQTVAQQLERFCKKPNKITLEFTTFKDNITALGTASLNMSETKLDVDYLVVSGTSAEPKKEKANVFQKLWHEVKSFVASFTVDYNAVGDVYDEKDSSEVVKVWVLTGRDQGTILKSMVDDSFTPNTGVKVNVEIVAADALLNAVLAGRGPNVVLSVGADQPVNYALRNAAEDITQFADYQEVLKPYTPSSYEQYSLDGHIYAIPETQTFNVMFYRKDVLEELELDVPNTWQELIEMLPTIQGSNLSVGIPTAAGSSGAASASTAVASNAPDLSLYFTLLYQYGGDLYNEQGSKTTVDNEAGVKAFDDYTRYFNDYGLPTIYDFVSRFRSGEMPIGVSAYSTYNTLMVSAPEIRGLWDFTLIPGTERVDEDGNTYLDRSDFISGSATMMIATDNEELRRNSWEFMKWWADSDTQVRFGREIEALLGSSARYATANRDAFSQLAWSYDDIQVLNEQWEQTVGIREVPGGYYTGRHLANAVRKVLNDKDDARETIIDYSIKIDEELTKKRKEFGLPIAE